MTVFASLNASVKVPDSYSISIISANTHHRYQPQLTAPKWRTSYRHKTPRFITFPYIEVSAY
uniref:Uncharacterized protein n=1 Tax=Papilio xuthus TaxID=66420 RepID=I4DLL8_PAPXU|nr:unknown unsecreted protein [Papilio xuthus]